MDPVLGSEGSSRFTVPARASAMLLLLGLSAVFDTLRAHRMYRNEFIACQVKSHGHGADIRAINSTVWDDINDIENNMTQWFGMGHSFRDISFNVLGVDQGIVHEVNRMVHNIQLWYNWATNIRGTQFDFPFEFGDDRMPSDKGVPCPYRVDDPRPYPAGDPSRGSSHGPQQSSQSSSSAGAGGSGGKPEPTPPKPEPKARPSTAEPKKKARSNLILENPPPAVMFSNDSMSADEDEDLTTKNNTWTYPRAGLCGRRLRAFKRPHVEKNGKEAVIIICTSQGSTDHPCGAYDEALVPVDSARNQVSGWEILLRRTTIYLISWAEGIVDPKVLRKYINKGNPEWVRLYRFILFRSQSNYVNVFPTPKTFALATCLGHDADPVLRKEILEEVKLPPAMTADSYNFLNIKSGATIVISDLPLNWQSTNRNMNDLQKHAGDWGWHNLQQYAPVTYGVKDEYLVQACRTVANLLERASPEDDIREASIHIWIYMTDILDYAGVKGDSVSFPVKGSDNDFNAYFQNCIQMLHQAGNNRNPIILNVNSYGSIIGCRDSPKFRRVTKEIVNHLRGEGHMVSWGGALWREMSPFLDLHGKINAKGDDKMLAMSVLEKQLYREKTLLKCMFASTRVNELDRKAVESGIARNEGLIDEPPEEYKYEDVNAVPLDPDSRVGRGGRKVRSRMHVPNWDEHGDVTFQPSIVQDGKFFWVKVERALREDDDDDPMNELSGLCDTCAIQGSLDRDDHPEHKNCPNCSANYTLRSFGPFDDEKDRRLRIYLAFKTKEMYESNNEWLSSDVSSDLKGFMQRAIEVVLPSEYGKAVSQYGFVRMHPTAAARMLSTQRGHLIITTRFREKGTTGPVNFRFSYDMGNKLYAAYMHALFPKEFIAEVFSSEEPKEEKLGDAVEILLGLMELWDSAPQCIPTNLVDQHFVNEIRRGIECSLIHFCAMGDTKMSSRNRKMNKRKGIKEEIPEIITGIDPKLNFYVPSQEEGEDPSPFSELLDEVEEEEEEDVNIDGDEEQDVQSVQSSNEDAKMDEGDEGEGNDNDAPMDDAADEGPEVKRRKVVKMMESVQDTAKAEGVCMACGEIGHTIEECTNDEQVKLVSDAWDTIMSKVKTTRSSFPKERRSREERRQKEQRPRTEQRPETVTTLYPEEISAFDKCAEYQGDHWSVMGKPTMSMGPESNSVIINDIIPEMGQYNDDYVSGEVMGLSQKQRENHYLDLMEEFPVGTMVLTPMFGVRYRHESFDNRKVLFPRGKNDIPPYPSEGSADFKAGRYLNKILRHYIGRRGSYETDWNIIRCNEGAWVLLEDLLRIDFIWGDDQNYDQAKRRDHDLYHRIKQDRTATIIKLTIAECETRGKRRFQLLSLQAKNEEEIHALSAKYQIKKPSPGTDFMDEEYKGWIMPIAVRATCGHTKDIGIPLDPNTMMKRLDLKAAEKLKGAYHVTSPAYLESILRNGIRPGGIKGKRVTSFFGIFPPWDIRNRMTRTKSPDQYDHHMLIVFVPPSELTRFEAGVSGAGDILVPRTVPPEEIREIWIAEKCRPTDDQDGKMRFAVTKPHKIYSKQIVPEIVTYADFHRLGRKGYIASREQVIDDAIMLIKKFPEPPIGDPEELKELRADVETLRASSGRTLPLHDEVRCRVVSKLARYHQSRGSTIMRMANRKCPCCLDETPSFLTICIKCNAEFWSAGRLERMIHKPSVPRNRWDRERINKNAEEAAKRAQEAYDNMPQETKDQYEEEEKEIREKVERMERESAGTEKKNEPEEASFAKEDPGEKGEEYYSSREDLSMFERNLRLPEEGAICLDSNLQASKYLIIHLMKRINKSLGTWWKSNIDIDREDKIANWKKGYRPEITGPDYPVKPIDPSTGEPQLMTDLEYRERLRVHKLHKDAINEDGCDLMAIRGYKMTCFIHKMRWAMFRIGLNMEDIAAMIDHNKRQTELQKARKSMLGGSGGIVDAVMKLQSDPSYTIMGKLIKMVTGCDSFTTLTTIRPPGCYYIDMEALIGDPVAKETDGEACVLLHHYGFTNLFGVAKAVLQKIKDKRSKLLRQLVDGEDYTNSLPQLEFMPQTEGGAAGSDNRPEEEPEEKTGNTPRIFAPGGRSYAPPRQESHQTSQGGSRNNSADVGATTKAHPPKAMPSRPEAKQMPSQTTNQPKQPPYPPPPSRLQSGQNDQYTDDEEPGQSSQSPIEPKGGKGKGRKGNRKGSQKGYQSNSSSSKGGWSKRHQHGWDYYGGGGGW